MQAAELECHGRPRSRPPFLDPDYTYLVVEAVLSG
jgi:hypothetical protein